MGMSEDNKKRFKIPEETIIIYRQIKYNGIISRKLFNVR
jgi:hypothetical protein